MCHDAVGVATFFCFSCYYSQSMTWCVATWAFLSCFVTEFLFAILWKSVCVIVYIVLLIISFYIFHFPFIHLTVNMIRSTKKTIYPLKESRVVVIIIWRNGFRSAKNRVTKRIQRRKVGPPFSHLSRSK